MRTERTGGVIAWLTVENGNGPPQTYEIPPTQLVTIGRLPNNVVVLRDEYVSRLHAVILRDDRRWFINSVGTPANAITVNDKLVNEQAELHHGCKISIGNTRLQFWVKAEHADSSSNHTSRSDTPLQPDDLTLLHEFLSYTVQEAVPQNVIRYALKTLYDETRAAVVGFLSLDSEAPLPKMIYPENEQVGDHLSRQLTQQVQREKRTVWLAGTISESLKESLGELTDAICVPLRVGDSSLGALHIYRASGLFSERNVRFCDVLAGHLSVNLQNLRRVRSLQADNNRLRNRAGVSEELVGNSSEMRDLRQLIARVAASSSTVLIEGESGVGKELVALSLHRQSPRNNAAMVVANCAAITSTLLESELFGHRKGSFTGADRDRQGLFQQADDGTLFFDEIGELPLEAQAKLLRVIEGNGFRPVGATSEVKPDVRILAATNRDLDREVKQGRFRRDLLFRLQVIRLHVPALREHLEDIPELADYFLKKWGRECARPGVGLTKAALLRLTNYSWPGNVRQLFAVLENALVMTPGHIIDASDLLIPGEENVDQPGSLRLEHLEQWAIRRALQKTRGNVTRAAGVLGVARDTLIKKMKRYHITRDRKA